jgi:hypothetical protein
MIGRGNGLVNVAPRGQYQNAKYGPGASIQAQKFPAGRATSLIV